MCTQYQRITATTFLFSILLQGCGGSDLKMADEEVPRDATDNPHLWFKTRGHSKLPKQVTGKRSTEASGELGVAPLPDRSEVSSEVLSPSSPTPLLACVRQAATFIVSQSM